MSPEKIKEVQKKIINGFPEGELRNHLAKEGYSPEEIEQCFPLHQYDMRSWYLGFGIFFLFIGFWILVQYNSFLFLIFSGFLLYLYFMEKKKFNKKEKES